ncbi:hypothetical protein ANN_13435 [Periplaneta americana]|uniref:C2H2-type domain-containing protein n=1 Tax=Periplaneta americana TaxID=6978 RepID=A0ABQ8TKE2_PERAM|nr:hypothetical protein ANN_13435 [Periplaneta americana]
MAPVRHRWSINDVIGGIRNTVMPSDCSPAGSPLYVLNIVHNRIRVLRYPPYLEAVSPIRNLRTRHVFKNKKRAKTVQLLQTGEQKQVGEIGMRLKTTFKTAHHVDTKSSCLLIEHERIACLLCPIQFISTRHFNIKLHFNKVHIKNYGMHKLSGDDRRNVFENRKQSAEDRVSGQYEDSQRRHAGCLESSFSVLITAKTTFQ